MIRFVADVGENVAVGDAVGAVVVVVGEFVVGAVFPWMHAHTIGIGDDEGCWFPLKIHRGVFTFASPADITPEVPVQEFAEEAAPANEPSCSVPTANDVKDCPRAVARVFVSRVVVKGVDVGVNNSVHVGAIVITEGEGVGPMPTTGVVDGNPYRLGNRFIWSVGEYDMKATVWPQLKEDIFVGEDVFKLLHIVVETERVGPSWAPVYPVGALA